MPSTVETGRWHTTLQEGARASTMRVGSQEAVSGHRSSVCKSSEAEETVRCWGWDNVLHRHHVPSQVVGSAGPASDWFPPSRKCLAGPELPQHQVPLLCFPVWLSLSVLQLDLPAPASWTGPRPPHLALPWGSGMLAGLFCPPCLARQLCLLLAWKLAPCQPLCFCSSPNRSWCNHGLSR